MSPAPTYFATASRGLESLLAAELVALGASDVKEKPGGVAFGGELAVAYRACLWSRTASRVLLPLVRAPLLDADTLYQAARSVDWTELFDLRNTFAIEVAGSSPAVPHTQYAGLKVKDAIADGFREKKGARPNVDTERPQILVHLHLQKEHCTLSLDLGGESLHRRGYRRAGVEAPLKENLAAGILLRAGWPALAAQGAPLLDPLCGSGTLVIEAALMAADVAPGLKRTRWGFEAWQEHQPKAWREIREDAVARAERGRASRLPWMGGSDIDPAAVRAAADNASRAGFGDTLRFEVKDLSEARPPHIAPPPTTGLVVCNPPYGERLSSESDVITLHSLLGATLKQHFQGWHAAVFTGRPDLGHRIGLRAANMHAMFNGPLACKLLRFEVSERAVLGPREHAGGENGDADELNSAPSPWKQQPKTGGADFANRLDKNIKHLAKWAKRSGVSCYRLYDGDLPDYAVAVDLYTVDGGDRHAYVQEYQAPRTIDPVKAEQRLRDALVHTQRLLELPAAHVHYRLRRAQKEGKQYGRQARSGDVHELVEHGVKLQVNFDEYLDTGLFLDHRPLRLRIQKESKGQRFLNLFCYTGSATAHAIVGGAAHTLSVDMSNTYLEWAQRNLARNGARAQLYDHPPSHLPDHALLRADCLKWLAMQEEKKARTRDALQYDLILCDPPTFSHSKKMEGVLDTQRDHVQLIRQCLVLLAPGGTLYFSTNKRGFKLDAEALADVEVKDITAQTLDEDFKRPPPQHKAWAIRQR